MRALVERERAARIGEPDFVSRLKQLFLVSLSRSARTAKSASNTALATNEKLKLLGILPDEVEVAAAVRRNYELQADLKPEQVRLTLQAAKELRTCFAHRFRQPSKKLVEIIKSSRFEDFPIRLTDDGYEVTLALSRMIAEVIQVMAYLINQKAGQNYGALFRESDEGSS